MSRLLVTITACRRPAATLRAIRAVRIAQYSGPILVSLDQAAGRDDDQVFRAIEHEPGVYVRRNRPALGLWGPRNNHQEAYDWAFEQEHAEAIVALEDDAVVSPDVFELVSWFLDGRLPYLFLSLANNTPSQGGRPLDLWESAHVNSPWAWSMTIAAWREIRKSWNFRDEPPIGWDFSLQHYMAMHGLLSLVPALARARNIGGEGSSTGAAGWWNEHLAKAEVSDGTHGDDYQLRKIGPQPAPLNWLEPWMVAGGIPIGGGEPAEEGEADTLPVRFLRQVEHHDRGQVCRIPAHHASWWRQAGYLEILPERQVFAGARLTSKPYPPEISICHATARPEGWQAAWAAWQANRSVPGAFYEYILCMDRRQAEELPRLPHEYHQTVINYGPENCNAAYNAAAARSCGRLLLLVADDVFPCRDWDKCLLEAIVRAGYSLDDDFVVWVSTIELGGKKGNDPNLIMVPILSRARFVRYGFALCEEYPSVYADNDLTEAALRDGAVIDCRQSILFEHRHFTVPGGPPKDEVYTRQNSPENYAEGERILQRRRAAGFPPLPTAARGARSLRQPPQPEADSGWRQVSIEEFLRTTH